MPCSGQFHFSHIADYIYDFCPLPDPDVGLSVQMASITFHNAVYCKLKGEYGEI